MKNKNEPAFPCQSELHGKPYTGITKWEYALMTAPNEVPEWFDYTEPGKPEKPIHWTERNWPSYDIEEEVRRWSGNMSYKIKSTIGKQYQTEVETFNQVNTEYIKRKQENRLFEWKKYYATKILSI